MKEVEAKLFIDDLGLGHVKPRKECPVREYCTSEALNSKVTDSCKYYVAFVDVYKTNFDVCCSYTNSIDFIVSDE